MAPSRRALGAGLSTLMLVTAGLLGAPGAQAAAGRAQPEPTTTSTTTPPAAKPAAPAPPAPTPDPPADGPAEPVPTDAVVIPPPPPGAAEPPSPDVQRKAQAELVRSQKTFDRLFSVRSAESRRFETLLTQTAALEARFTVVDGERRQQEGRLLEAREQLKRLAVARYVATPVAPLSSALEASDVVDLSRRFALLGAVSDADKGRIEEYQAASRAVTDELDRVNADLARSRKDLEAARGALQKTDATLIASKAQLLAAQTGGIITTGGLSFPVAGPHSFTDSFGAPRMFGTAFAHLHEGTDIFATAGTPLVAIERGVVISMGTDTLGGIKLWLVGATGTRYYYAHLSAFAPGVTNGKPVQAGEVLGFVGSTGNAQGTSPHLHFEAHPDGGAAINPYPLLRIIDDFQKRAAPPPPPP